MIVVSGTTTTMDWSDVKRRFLEACETGQWRSQGAFDDKALKWHASVARGAKATREQWEGQSAAETVRYLREGFKSPLFQTHNVVSVPRRRKRARWDECDGDADAGRLLGGCDDFYLTRGHVDARPGLTLEVMVAFSGSVPADKVAAYGAWVASLIGALEADGYDLEVAITVPTVRRTFNECPDQPHTTRIIVKRPGEVSDFASWSVLFSPGGFRHLCFTGIGMAADKRKLTATSGLGTPDGRGWAVERDEQDPSRIAIHCQPQGRGEMLDKLNAGARAAGIL